jgi:flagellar biosynthetic protein FlhB
VALALLAGFTGLYYTGSWLMSRGAEAVTSLLAEMTSSQGAINGAHIERLTANGLTFVVLAVLPIAVLTCGMTVASGLLQTGFCVHVHLLRPDVARLSLRRGMRRLLSIRSLARGVFATLKVVGVGAIVVWLTAGALEIAMAPLSGRTVLSSWRGEPAGLKASWGEWWRELGTVGLKISFFLLALGLLEYLFERRQHERDLRMTRAELEEEIVRHEGNRKYKAWRLREGATLVERTRKSQQRGGA